MKNETELPRCLDADPGEGYRLVLPGEIILDTDEYFSDVFGEWLTVKLGAGRAHKPGYEPRRRKLEPAYRLLEVGEIIQEGDEVKNGDAWEKVSWTLSPLSKCFAGFFRTTRPLPPTLGGSIPALPKQQEPLVNAFDPAKPVRTRSGEKARIIATDVKGSWPILALVEEKADDGSIYEACYSYTVNGSFVDDYSTDENDLVNFEPEPRGKKWTPGDLPPDGAIPTRTVLATNAKHAKDGESLNVSQVFPAYFETLRGEWRGPEFEPIPTPIFWKDINW